MIPNISNVTPTFIDASGVLVAVSVGLCALAYKVRHDSENVPGIEGESKRRNSRIAFACGILAALLFIGTFITPMYLNLFGEPFITLIHWMIIPFSVGFVILVMGFVFMSKCVVSWHIQPPITLADS